MSYPSWLVIDIYTLVIAALILFFNMNWRTNNDRKSQLFNWMLIAVIVLDVADAIGRFYLFSTSGFSMALTYIGNYVIFAFDPLYFILATYYLSCWMLPSENELKWVRQALCVIGAVNFVVVSLSVFAGLNFLYYFDENGIYHRGPLFLLRALLLIAALGLVVYYTIKRRDDIPPKYRTVLMIFPMIGIVGCLLQSVTTGLPFEYVGTTISSLVLFVYLQSRDMTEDFLTGSMNRRSLDVTLEEKINASREGHTFSGIMIDVDFFKSINDTFGHAVGDDALRDVFTILHSCLRSEDQIARYGGDEFFVITPITEREYLEKAARRIRNRLSDFNEQNGRPYKLSLSLGYDVYDPESEMTAEKFIKHLDDMMYEEKERHHAEAGKPSR